MRRALPGARLVRAGVSLSRLRGPLAGPVVTCGLAGALRPEVPTGTVLVPECVIRPDGAALRCDPQLVEALLAAARQLGLEPMQGPMLTSKTLVVGARRAEWAERGCVGADMETGLLEEGRVASVRVVLDTPEREVSAVLQHPARAIWQPRAWGELAWLARQAPRCARLAADVLALAFPLDPRGP